MKVSVGSLTWLLLALGLLELASCMVGSTSTLVDHYKLDERIDKLKWKARKYLTQKKYKYAAKYYSAVLQVLI